MTAKIKDPGVYKVPEDEYHQDPLKDDGGSLSPSMAKYLIPGEPFNGCPALYRYACDHPQPPKKEFDFGHVAHKLLLGYGQQIDVIDVENWTTKAAREKRDAAYKADRIPIKKSDFDQTQAMANEVWRHPFAGNLFEDGQAERSLFWKDPQHGVWLRTRPDWLPKQGRFFADYKTASSAAPDEFRRRAFQFGYFLQAAMRVDAIKALGIHDDPCFLFAVQEKTPPYLIVVYQPTAAEIEWGRIMARKAIDTYARCCETGDWSEGYADDVVSGILPGWAEGRLERQHELGLYEISMAYNAPLEEAAQ